jgi:two-component system cell cycle sensor histidine kinase/response regulator CckA
VKSFRDISIKRKMLVMTLVICGSVLFVAILALFTFQILNFRSNYQRDTATLAAIVAENSTAALAFRDAAAAAEVIGSLQAKPNMESAVLTAADGSIFAHYGRLVPAAFLTRYPRDGEFLFEGGKLLYTRPVVLEKKRLGTLYLSSDYGQTLGELLEIYGLVIVGITLVSVGLAMSLAGRLQRIIADPILRLAETAQAVGERSDYSLRIVASDRSDELGRLSRTFNEMLERIESQDQAIKESRERFSKAFDFNPTPISLHSMRDGAILDANMGFRALAGRVPMELIGKKPDDVGLCADMERFHDFLAMLRKNWPVRDEACRLRTGAGAIRDIMFSAEAIEIEGADCFIAAWRDITDQLVLEKQLRHSQKMDAVGQLSAGIAHDFNNLLTVIQGNASLAIADGQGAPDLELLEGILTATHSAAKLVRQLLTFSNKQVMEVATVDIEKLMASISEMLPRLIGEDILLKFEILPDLPMVRVDTIMIEQMILNLSVNARDAMPRGGRMTIRAEAVEIAADAVRRDPLARAGRFLCLSVSDTGTGIPADVLPHIFEPFFTTKPVGKGSGLGLATTYGIAKQHGGWISVESELGRGTTFRCFLAFESEDPLKQPQPDASPLVGNAHDSGAAASYRGSGPVGSLGSETVLVVEDEDSVRRFVTKTLEFHGYTVISARDGVEALRIWDRNGTKIDLLLTDVVMPHGISGTELARRLSEAKPALKVILTSGYNRELAAGTTLMPGRNRFIAKPYEYEALLKAVRSSLDSKEG